MAMTKAEQMKVESLRIEVALRWTGPVECDVPPPTPGKGGYTEGWSFNTYTGDVELCWSSCIYHGNGRAPLPGKQRSAGSHGAMSLYSTQERALRALRHEYELQVAAKLREMDRRIEASSAATLADKVGQKAAI